MKRRIILTAIFAAVALFLSVGAIGALAQGPVNTDPSRMLYFDNQPHLIPGATPLWYVFDYAGDKSPIVTRMTNAANTGLGFNVYTVEQVRRLRSEDKPLGRGTSSMVPCGSDKCQDSDLTWTGNTPIGGIYIVEVTNSTPQPQTFNLTITGAGVGLGTPLLDNAPLPQPTATLEPPTTTLSNTPDVQPRGTDR